MARRVDEDKRVAIAEAALALLRERGAHRTSMSDIAKALGMKRSTLYWYFGDLNAIFEAVFERLLDDLGRYLAARFRGLTHPIDLLDAHLVAVHDYYDGREDEVVFLLQLWAVTGSDQPGRALELTRRYFVPRREAAKALVRQGIARGTVAPCDPEALVDTVAAIVDGLLVHRVTNRIPAGPSLAFVRTHLLAPLKRAPATPGGHREPVDTATDGARSAQRSGELRARGSIGDSAADTLPLATPEQRNEPCHPDPPPA